MTLLAKVLLHKHEDMTANIQLSLKQKRMVAHAGNSSAGDRERDGSLDCHSIILVEHQEQ